MRGDMSLTLKTWNWKLRRLRMLMKAYKNQYEATVESGEDPNKSGF
jgi:hypothetical protein